MMWSWVPKIFEAFNYLVFKTEENNRELQFTAVVVYRILYLPIDFSRPRFFRKSATDHGDHRGVKRRP
jgi:hypothetical protein